MTKMVRCAAGLHQYDADRHSICPHCSANLLVEDTQSSINISNDKTRPVRRLSSANEETVDLGTEQTTALSNDTATRVIKTQGNDPTTAWLVVIDGPGKGFSLPVFIGINTIGRGPEQSICLDFGDQQDDKIARDAQAKLTYDVKGNCFYIQHGETANLTYLNDEPILEPKKLKAYDRITMGQTILMFIPFCGKKFTWDDA